MSEAKGVVKYTSVDKQEITLTANLCRQYLVSGKAALVTESELLFFMGICKSRGLNPWGRDCFLIKYREGSPAAIVISADFHRMLARQQPDCMGWRNGIILRNEKSEIEYREGHFILESEALLGGWFEAKPRGWEVLSRHTVSIEPYIRLINGKPTAFWTELKQPLMIAKIALVQGLRALWPAALAKLYTQEEIFEDSSPVSVSVEKPRESEVVAEANDTEADKIAKRIMGAADKQSNEFSQGMTKRDELLAKYAELKETYPDIVDEFISDDKVKGTDDKALEKTLKDIEAEINRSSENKTQAVRGKAT